MASKNLKDFSSIYLAKILSTPMLAVQLKKASCVTKKLKFDSIAFRGMSGSLIAAPLALQLKKI